MLLARITGAICPECGGALSAFSLRSTRTTYGTPLRPVTCETCQAELRLRGGKWPSILINSLMIYAVFLAAAWVISLNTEMIWMIVAGGFLATVLVREVLHIRLLRIDVVKPGSSVFEQRVQICGTAQSSLVLFDISSTNGKGRPRRARKRRIHATI